MPLVAYDQDHCIDATQAVKGRCYTCVECRDILKVRSGTHIRPHFYHIHPTKCRQQGRSGRHLFLQMQLLSHFKGPDIQLEHPFPTIGRIADLFHPGEHLVLEVQCSPISLQEVQARCRDYHSLHLNLLWLLDDRRFNRPKLADAEQFLLNQGLALFINRFGRCYRQVAQVEHSRRIWRASRIYIPYAQLKQEIGHKGLIQTPPRQAGPDLERMKPRLKRLNRQLTTLRTWIGLLRLFLLRRGID